MKQSDISVYSMDDISHCQLQKAASDQAQRGRDTAKARICGDYVTIAQGAESQWYNMNRHKMNDVGMKKYTSRHLDQRKHYMLPWLAHLCKMKETGIFTLYSSD
jgi:hypothetical protein